VRTCEENPPPPEQDPEQDGVLAEPIAAFENAIRYPMTENDRAMIINAYNGGLSPPIIAKAFALSVENNAQNRFRYAQSILNGWVKQRIYTLDDWERSEALRQSRASPPGQTPKGAKNGKVKNYLEYNNLPDANKF
jgi:DnaD/phage-associated family protein